MLLFVLKNLLLLSACVLAVPPCVLAVLNFRRRTAVKRRALTNLLSDPSIVAQYKDCFQREKDSRTRRALRRIISTHSGRLSMQNRLFRASLLLAGFALPGHAQLVFQAPDPIALHAGSGEVTFTL